MSPNSIAILLNQKQFGTLLYIYAVHIDAHSIGILFKSWKMFNRKTKKGKKQLSEYHSFGVGNNCNRNTGMSITTIQFIKRSCLNYLQAKEIKLFPHILYGDIYQPGQRKQDTYEAYIVAGGHLL